MVISGNQRSSEAISGHQRSSVVIRGNQFEPRVMRGPISDERAYGSQSGAVGRGPESREPIHSLKPTYLSCSPNDM